MTDNKYKIIWEKVIIIDTGNSLIKTLSSFVFKAKVNSIIINIENEKINFWDIFFKFKNFVSLDTIQINAGIKISKNRKNNI
ncbi:MAG: hypothetical protein ACTSRZ_19695 [Promethearchaeota archaeon]